MEITISRSFRKMSDLFFFSSLLGGIAMSPPDLKVNASLKDCGFLCRRGPASRQINAIQEETLETSWIYISLNGRRVFRNDHWYHLIRLNLFTALLIISALIYVQREWFVSFQRKRISDFFLGREFVEAKLPVLFGLSFYNVAWK